MIKLKSYLSFVFLFLSLIFSACGGGDDTSSGKSLDKMDPYEVSRTYISLTQEIRKFANEKGLMDDPQIEAADQKAFEAAKAFTQTRKAHPELKELFAQSDAFQDQAIDAKLNKDDAGYDLAMDEYKKIRLEIEKKSSTLPEIKGALKALQAVNDKQTQVVVNVVKASGPEGEKLAERYAEVHAKLKEVRP